MNKKRTAAPVCKTENGEGQVAFEGFDESENDCIIKFKPAQGTVAALLLPGRANALTASELARIAGVDRRKVTLEIMRERRNGSPIMSDGTGFWIAENREELVKCCLRLHSRANEIHRTARLMVERIGDVEHGKKKE